jgi:hypothetical protein
MLNIYFTSVSKTAFDGVHCLYQHEAMWLTLAPQVLFGRFQIVMYVYRNIFVYNKTNVSAQMCNIAVVQ